MIGLVWPWLDENKRLQWTALHSSCRRVPRIAHKRRSVGVTAHDWPSAFPRDPDSWHRLPAASWHWREILVFVHSICFEWPDETGHVKSRGRQPLCLHQTCLCSYFAGVPSGRAAFNGVDVETAIHTGLTDKSSKGPYGLPFDRPGNWTTFQPRTSR